MPFTWSLYIYPVIISTWCCATVEMEIVQEEEDLMETIVID